MNKQIDVRSAIDLLKSGETIDNVVISDMTTSKVMAMDALLLAKNGFIVPDGNIVYDDDQVQYDPDFDDVTWGKPIPFKQLKESLTSEIAIQHASEGTEAHEEAIGYRNDDDDIAYDPDFDDVEWSKEPIHLTWDEKFKLAAEFEKNKSSEEEVSLKINISDPEIRQWMYTHADKLSQLIGNFIAEVYKENQPSKA
jgi:hypothetical protein